MAESYIGEIRIFAGNYAPSDWAFCDGQLLSISEYDTLYALIGTRYGGDGVSNFALPDFRGRIPVGMGTGPGLTQRVLGQKFGTEKAAIPNGIPTHSHSFMGSTVDAQTTVPTGKVLAKTVNALYYEQIDGDETIAPLNPNSIQSAGGNQQHDNMMPSFCINYIISLIGYWPDRN